MMHRIREIHAGYVSADSRTASLLLIIHCVAMATKVVDVATESEEDLVINCVAIFYEEGKER